MAPVAAEQIKDVNVRYHDVAAPDYDSKWGIDFGEKGRRQVLGKLRKALGGEPRAPFQCGLEIGAGTGYFTLNLMLAGVIREAVATDISTGMLAALSDSADSLGLSVRTVRTEAERLPFPDESFDLVFGHAVLHHLPDLDASFAEFMRVLRRAWGIGFGLPATKWMLEIGAFFLRTETELILKSRRVVPGRLLNSDFEFRFPTWAEAAAELCGRWRETHAAFSDTQSTSVAPNEL